MRAALALALLVSPAFAEEAQVETSEIAASVVTFHKLPTLDDQEVQILRTVATNEQALQLFVPDASKGFAAIAISPSEGFLDEGAPVKSAIALSGFASAEQAAKASLAACDAARAPEAEACTLVLEIAPKS
jgi:hypothetical protein